VPTLDTPMPAGKNVIWCGTFQMAWNRLRDDVIKEPIRITGAEEIAARLNTAPLKESDLPPGSFYAAAGKVSDGIVETIHQEMAKRFPKATPYPFEGVDPDDLVAYGYLRTSAKFALPYWDHEYGQAFTDSAGNKTHIRTFGLYHGHGYAPDNGKVARQVQVLYAEAEPAKTKDSWEKRKLTAFAADLCRTSQPNQLILAVVERKETLAATWADLKIRIDSWDSNKFKPFDSHCRLEVPNLNWKLKHEFTELAGEDKRFENAGFSRSLIGKAFQMIDFSLNKGGADLESEAALDVKEAAMDRPDLSLVFDRPFLIVMRQRGCEEPFFMMWVDNAELLVRPEK